MQIVSQKCCYITEIPKYLDRAYFCITQWHYLTLVTRIILVKYIITDAYKVLFKSMLAQLNVLGKRSFYFHTFSFRFFFIFRIVAKIRAMCQ